MKKFLLVTSQLSEKNLAEFIYEPVDNPDLAYGLTHFPAIPMINAYTEEGEHIQIISVTYDMEYCHRNLKLFEKELSAVCSKHDATYDLDSIVVPFDDSLSAVLGVYQQLINRVEDGDELFADITYGSKPMPIVLTMALQYAYRLKDNVSIECVTYGQVSHYKKSMDAKIYDVTALVQLDEIVRLMSDGRVSDPSSVISTIIGE